MYTRCPKCATLYDIDEEALARADGIAHCLRCDTVFDLYSLLEEDDDPFSPLALQDPINRAEPVDSSLLLQSNFNLDSESLLSNNEVSEPIEEPAAYCLIPAEDDEAADDEATMASSYSRPLPFEVPDDLPEIIPSTAAKGGIEIPDDLPELAPMAQSALDIQADAKGRMRLPTGLLSLLALLLLITAIGQILWFKRDRVILHPMGLVAAEQLCKVVGCTLPPRRAPGKLNILHRKISPATDYPDALDMYVIFSNEASFPQPYPDMQLTFLDPNEIVLARRRFTPQEYVFPSPASTATIPPKEVVTIDLLLEDPGDSATGFKIDFL